jgi:hypothetical protein
METTLHPDADTHAANGQSHEVTPGLPLGSGSGDTQAKAKVAVVDLAAWARGNSDLPFDQVQKAIDDYAEHEIEKTVARFIGIDSPRDAVRFVVAEGIITADEARDDL